MSIVKMKRLRLIGLHEGREELLRQLQRLGCVQIDAVTAAQDDPDWAGLVHPDSGALDQARARYDQAQEALRVLQRAAPEKKGLLEPLPQATQAQLFDEEVRLRATADADELCAMERELAELDAEAEKLAAQRKELAPWVELDVPLDTPSTPSVSVIFGSLPLRVDLEAAQTAMGDPGQLCTVLPAGTDRESRYLLLLCHKSVEESVLSALRGLGFIRLTFREKGTALDNETQLAGRYEANRAKATALRETMTAYGQKRRELELSADRALQEVERQQARTRLLDTDATFFLSGWFPAEDEARVTAVLEQYPCAWECTDPTQEEYPQVPIQLKNNPVTASVNPITEMYSMPAYGSVDPNPLMAPFFILFFGFMMNDIAYGLLMVLGTAVFLKLKRPRDGMRNMMMLFLLCGVSSIFWGCLTGSFFGDFFPQLFKLLDPTSDFVWFWPTLFTPINDIILVMIGSMALGVIQVFTGMAVSAASKFRHGQAMDAVTQEIAWWCILLGAAALIAGSAVAGLPVWVGLGGKVVMILGFVLLLAGNLIRSKGLGGLIGFGGDIYNGISGYFSDILSYLRLMALMMAGSIIASVFNTLGAVFGLVPFLIVALIGNALNLVLNLLGCYVHTMRLQCLEFFGRFYQDGGKAFRPLTINTKYVDIM